MRRCGAWVAWIGTTSLATVHVVLRLWRETEQLKRLPACRDAMWLGLPLAVPASFQWRWDLREIAALFTSTPPWPPSALGADDTAVLVLVGLGIGIGVALEVSVGLRVRWTRAEIALAFLTGLAPTAIGVERWLCTAAWCTHFATDETVRVEPSTSAFGYGTAALVLDGTIGALATIALLAPMVLSRLFVPPLGRSEGSS